MTHKPELILNVALNGKLSLIYSGHSFYSIQVLNVFVPLLDIRDVESSYTVVIANGKIESIVLLYSYNKNENCISRTHRGQKFIYGLIERNRYQ